ncbi:hypothetical protein BDDG_12122 [Blastomyces dermatitidis ATCC 18188]|uniref:Uncharacterized protein n=1 Tax=Ajellomyces dermatitidis (strain ATCC 18188 / CBS 674.68) TaxID=653446 RepID=A0A0J9EQF6_AJEDA|nr:hypothetical protein BDDG_12122 [Blastomyces dermatitidis ATCC 18188]
MQGTIYCFCHYPSLRGKKEREKKFLMRLIDCKRNKLAQWVFPAFGCVMSLVGIHGVSCDSAAKLGLSVEDLMASNREISTPFVLYLD